MFGKRRRRAVCRPVRRLGASPALSRATDRVEDLVAWLLVSLGLLAILGAVVVGMAAHAVSLRPGE